MNYQETTEFMFSRLPAFHRIGKAAYKGDLNTTIALDNYTGNPHRRYHTIHVAGTNGKGSVSHMLASILQEAGYKTGLYTSPHLRDFRERIRVNGKMIPEDSVIDFVEKKRNIISELEPSFFEMTVAMAFDYFSAEAVDVAVVEVGLGGRLDSTNIINPVLSVITNIGHDHMDLLGDTLPKIAAEKAGIIKRQVPVVISETQPEVKEVFLSKARDSGSAILFADSRFSCTLGNGWRSGERNYTVSDHLTNEIKKGLTALCGDYQARNIQAVYASVMSLQERFTISWLNVADGIRKVISNTGLAGRWQILSHEPLTICDTGHNREGLEFVMSQLGKIQRPALHMILGFVNDKDLGSVLPLFPPEAEYYFTRASIPRALDENILRSKAAEYSLHGNSYPDVKTALNIATGKAGKSDLIFIGGSTFIVAEVI